MPELPDVELYLHALRPRVIGRTITGVRLSSPFVLRSVDPPIADCEGRAVTGVRRLGKRLVLALDGERFMVIHLMIAGRLRWDDRPAEARPVRPPRGELARLDFEHGAMRLTEAGTSHRASIHVVAGEASLADHDPGGLEPLEIDAAAFARVLRDGPRRTLKRALTDPATLAGIGNAYSDEILHAARLSPLRRTDQLDAAALARLHDATVATLTTWRDRLIRQLGDRFPGPGQVTAFRLGMAVHGRFGEPCPVCGTSVARIVRGDTELDYCPGCQTDGRVLKDRSLSRLLKDDWPG